MSPVKVNSEMLALKDYSSFDSPRYDCVLFVSLIKLNGESFAAKNVHFLSLVKVHSESLALKDYSSFDSPRYACVLFMSLNGEWIALMKRSNFFVICFFAKPTCPPQKLAFGQLFCWAALELDCLIYPRLRIQWATVDRTWF